MELNIELIDEAEIEASITPEEAKVKNSQYLEQLSVRREAKVMLWSDKDFERSSTLDKAYKEELEAREFFPDVHLTRMTGDYSVDDRNASIPYDSPVDPVLEFHKVGCSPNGFSLTRTEFNLH